MRGLYFHIPFCASKCPYCDFYSVLSRSFDADSFVCAVKDEIKTLRRSARFVSGGLSFDTVYFGGGTPSVIGAERIIDVLRAARDYMNIAPDAEITVECNPSSTDDDFFSVLAGEGVNRVSLGMQSAVDGERRILGRKSGKEEVMKAINGARRAGIDIISLDVMLAIPHQTLDSLNETIDFCLQSGAEHISAYMLSLEPGTFFYKKRDSLELPSEDEACEMYIHLSDRLRKNGFRHYEISNFARKNCESRHNLNYWRCGEYLGIGPAAHSHIGGSRFYQESDLGAFIEGKPVTFDCSADLKTEMLMLSLRLEEGLSLDEYERAVGEPIGKRALETAKKMQALGLMTVGERSVALTRRGFLVSNSVISELMT